MKPLVIYHKNCADGFGAAWAAYQFFGDEAEYLAMNYNDPRVELHDEHLNFPVPVKDREVYVLDFSFKPNIHAALLAEAKLLVWLDHHKTAFEDRGLDSTKPNTFIGTKEFHWLNPSKSGCILAWEHFCPTKPVPRILELIDDRDRWVWAYGAETRNFATALRSKLFSFEAFDWAAANTDKMIADGAAMNVWFDQQLVDIVSKPMSIELSGKTGLAVNCTPQFASEAGNKLAEKSGTFGATWYLGQDGRVAFSLRSIGGYDVSEIARVYGGGGHKNAAGLSTEFRYVDFLVGYNTLTVYSHD